MPELSHRTPSISAIYAAFSVESDRVFHVAMTNSRGGIVRVSDLLAALLAEGADAACRMPTDQFRLPTTWGTSNEPHLVPMSNEPALREVLRIAFLIGSVQPTVGETPITPSVLWAAVIIQRQLFGGLDREEIFQRLGLRCPAALRMPVGFVPPASTATAAAALSPSAAPTPAELEELIDGRELIDVVLERWLALQALPAGTERHQELACLARLTQQLQTRP